MLRLIILFTIFHHILALQSFPDVCKDGKKDVSINIWKSMLKFDNELNNICKKVSKDRLCIAYYLSRHPYIFGGYISHIGIAVLNDKDVYTYGLTKSGRWNTPDLLLKGGVSKSGKNVPHAYKFKIIGVNETSKENLVHFKREKVNYSILGYNGENCADAVIDIASKLDHNITCNFLGVNIPDLCVIKY